MRTETRELYDKWIVGKCNYFLASGVFSIFFTIEYSCTLAAPRIPVTTELFTYFSDGFFIRSFYLKIWIEPRIFVVDYLAVFELPSCPVFLSLYGYLDPEMYKHIDNQSKIAH